MKSTRSHLLALAAGAALAWIALAPPSPARAGTAVASEEPDEDTAPDEDAGADDAPTDDDEAASDDGMIEVVDDPDDEGDEELGDDAPDPNDPDEERRTMAAFLGGAGTSIEEADGTLRPPSKLPVFGGGVLKAASAAGRGGSHGGSSGAPSTGGGRPGGTAAGGTGTQGAPTPAKSGGRIFGGSVVREGVTWQAELYGPFPLERWSAASRNGREPWEVRHYCGGSLIARDWVLTAAHCVYAGMDKKGFRIRLGARDISRDDGVSFPIERIVVHPGWNEHVMYRDDIALIRIVPDQPQLGTGADPKRPPAYSPIPIHRGPAPGDMQAVRATGWGKTRNVDLDKGSAVLLQAEMNVVAQSRCTALPGYGPEKIHGNVLCASAPARQTCRGDSGGPIVFAEGAPVLVGVVSWGKEKCTGDNQPGVYTRVGAYTAWIDSVIRASAR